MAECPPDQELKALLGETRDGSLVPRLSAHLDVCSRCQVRLEELARRSWAEGVVLPERLSEGEASALTPSVLENAMAGLTGRSVALPSRSRVDLSGTEFGDFELIDEIARGGMGVVYRARQISLNRLVALKILGSGVLVSPDRVVRFQTETEAVASIEHPNIVPIYSVGEYEGQPFFSMKLIEGGSLGDRLSELTPSAIVKSGVTTRTDVLDRQRVVVSIMIALCRAIHYTHERGILHRDLKPNNVLLDEQNEPHLTDFGLAKILEKDSQLTDSFAVMGTPSYMAPEQAAGQSRQITKSADIYGLGAIFYELLCGVPPFKEATPLATMRRVIDSDPPAPRSVCGFVDADLETICLKALNKEPASRYPDAEQMARDFERWWDGEPVMARPVSVGEKTWRWARRNPLSTALIGLVVLLAVCLLAGAVGFSVRLAESYRESEALVAEFQLAKAGDSLAMEDPMTGIAMLGKILETNPTHGVAARRLVSALTQRDLATLSSVPIDHGSRLRKVVVSPDQEHMVSLGLNGSIKLWNCEAATGDVAQLEAVPGRIMDVVFDRQGDRLLAGDDRGYVIVWDVFTGGVLGRQRMHDSAVESIEVGQSGKLAVSGAQDGTVQVWDIETGELGGPPLMHGLPVREATLDRAGERVLTVCLDGFVRVWERDSAQVVAGPFNHIGALLGAEFDPTERWVVSHGLGSRAVVWNIDSDEPVKNNIDHQAPIMAARYNPNGRSLVTVGRDGLARIWDALSGKALQTLATKKPQVQDVVFGPLGDKMLLVASGGICQLWDGAGQRMLMNPLRHPGLIVSAVFSPDGRSVVTGCDDGKIRTWHVGSYPYWDGVVRHGGPVNAAEFMPDGQAVATAGQDGLLKVTELVSGLPRFRPTRFFRPLRFASVSQSGELILAAQSAPRLPNVALLFSGLDGRRVLEPFRQRMGFTSGEIGPGDGLFALGTQGGAASVWRVSNELDPVQTHRHEGPVSFVHFDAGGNRFLSGGIEDSRVMVSDLRDGADDALALEHPEPVRAAVFHSERDLILTACTDYSARLWTFAGETYEQFGRPMVHEDVVNWVSFSPDGESLLTASDDGTVVCWDVAEQTPVGVPIVHTGPVTQAHFDPSGRRILVVGGDQKCVVWDMESGVPLSEPLGHDREIYHARFSPDGKFVLTAGADDVARVWSMAEPPLPVPIWFCRFLRSITGMEVDSRGARNWIDEQDLVEIRQEVHRLPRDDYYERLAHWLLESGMSRTIGPEVSETLAEYVEEDVRWNTFTSIREALLYAPTKVAALSAQTKLLMQDMGRQVSSRREAAFYSRRAIELAPNDPDVWLLRAELMGASGRVVEEWEARERYLDLLPSETDVEAED